MHAKEKPKGRWLHRFVIRVFTLILAVLIFWCLGFFVQDIKSIKGPDYNEISKRHLDQAVVDRKAALEKQIGELEREIGDLKEEQRVVGDSSQNLQKTMGQLIELQRLSIQKSVALPEAQQGNLSTSLDHFLGSQERYQELNGRITARLGEKRDLEGEKRSLEELLAEQRKPAQEEYNRLSRKHRLKLAALQLAVLIPLLLVGAFLTIRKRSSIYFPLFLAFGGATLLKVTLIIHEYFPTRYFRYILVAVLLLAVGKLLIHFIRTVAFPKKEWLTKQYREAYERFLCPVCEYPIRIGPRKFLYWTRRTVNRVVMREGGESAEEIYTCPACGTSLLEECAGCGKVRHSLLPNCRHCGVEKDAVS